MLLYKKEEARSGTARWGELRRSMCTSSAKSWIRVMQVVWLCSVRHKSGEWLQRGPTLRDVGNAGQRAGTQGAVRGCVCRVRRTAKLLAA